LNWELYSGMFEFFFRLIEPSLIEESSGNTDWLYARNWLKHSLISKQMRSFPGYFEGKEDVGR